MTLTITPPPTDAEWFDHIRWAVQPVGDRRQMWVEREAVAIHRSHTGRADPWPCLDDYTAANKVVPADYPNSRPMGEPQ